MRMDKYFCIVAFPNPNFSRTDLESIAQEYTSTIPTLPHSGVRKWYESRLDLVYDALEKRHGITVKRDVQ